MKTSEEGKKLIKQREGFRNKAYQCQAGKWTIGYGSLSINGTRVYQGMTTTKEDAEKAFEIQLPYYENIVNEQVKVPLTQNQFDALVSFAYNLGVGGFRYWSTRYKAWVDSGLKQRLNKKNYRDAANELSRWVYADGKVSQGLKNRRAAEKKQFLTKC